PSGKDITPGKLKLRGSMIDVIEGKDGNLILVETEGFNLIDAKTNEFIWKKSYKIEFLDEVVPLTDGYIAIGKNEEAGSISMVDNNGKKIWDCGVKGYVYYAAPTSKGVLYISTRKSNILSYENGKEIWDKDVKFKSIPAVTFDTKEQKVILFENGKGYKFDLNTGAIELFAEDIKLENVEKDTPLTAEYIQNGYFITSDQYASLLTPQGNLAYTHYYEPVSTVDLTSLAEFGLSMAGVDIDIKGSMENINALSALAHGAYVTSKDQNDAKSETSVISGMYLGEDAEHMTPVYEITQTRFSNTKETRDYKFMTVKNKEERGTKNYIYMLNKNSGEIVKKIELIDKTPDYVIDNVDKRIFVNEGNHLITAYQL
ncbi:MAG TPA: hypothetical protein PLB87_08990, partial [Prolixibacteraceae bacterium]|nr:hypothetical protein [Prolixibacteraceae bacterium]